MPNSDQSSNLRIQLDTKNCECSAAEIEKMERALDALARVIRSFPVSVLYVTIIWHERSQDFHVKTSLVLPGRTLFTGERHREKYTAYELCIGKLVAKVTAYKVSLDQAPERSKQGKGTRQDIVPTQVPDHEAVQSALADRDYARFREATSIYEESVRKRIGRWIQRYPELNQMIDERFTIADLVEGVFLTAFEESERKSNNILPGVWLEGLIDREIHDFMGNPEGELENISMALSALEAESTER